MKGKTLNTKRTPETDCSSQGPDTDPQRSEQFPPAFEGFLFPRLT